MRNRAAWFVGCVLVLGAALAWAQQKAPDAVAVDPDVHQVVFENEHVRVFEARAEAGATSPMHSHPPILLIGVGSSGFRVKFTLRDGSTQIMDVRPGQVIWIDGAEHSWKMLAGSAHVVAVEVKSAQPKAKP